MDELKERDEAPLMTRQNAARAVAIGGFVGLAVFSLAYRALVLGALEQSAAMFVGLPTLLATLTVLLARPRTAIGMALVVTTLALLASAVVFHEGFVCVLFAAPLFYGISIGVAVVADAIRGARGGPRAFASALLPLLVLSLEGVWIDLPRDVTVTASAVVAADQASVLAALAEPPDLEHPLPGTLKIGFPLPVRAHGTGIERGARRVIHFAGGEGHPGDMVFEVVESTPDRIRFALVQDDSHIAHWLRWDASEVRLVPVEGGTRVDWTVRYTRELDPAWYFDPLQRVAMHAAADWLIDATATPR